jgi:hypothetical protein
MMTNISITKNSSVVLSALSLITLLVFTLLSTEVLKALLGETGPIEIVSALSYIAAFVLFGLAANRSTAPYRYHFLMWAVFSIVFFGEETSWLQHYLGFETPEAIKSANAQNEFNLHNLEIFHGRKIIRDGEFVSLDWKHLLLSSQMLFQLGFGFYFFAIPLFRIIKPLDHLFSRLGFPTIRPSFTAPILIALIVCLALTVLNRTDHTTKSFWAETREMIFALGIFYFSLIAYFKSSKSHQ